ncbi:MAG: caspase family protein [Blastocatellia bacterium]
MNCLRKTLTLALIVLIAQGWRFPARAENDQNPDRALKVQKPKDSTAERPAETGIQTEAARGPQLVVQLGHSAEISSLALSSGGRMVLTAGDQTARLWDAETGKEIRTFRGHSKTIVSAVFSPDEQLILTAGYDDTARLWDASTGREIRKFEEPLFDVKSAAFSPDGRWILARCLNDARLLDRETGREIRRFQAPGLNSVAISADGKLILTGSGEVESGSDKNMRLWDAATGKEIRRFSGHSSLVNAVALSRDGQLALTGSADQTARLWNTATGREVKRLTGHSYTVGAVAISPDSRLALTACTEEETAWLWDIATGKKIREFVGHTYPVVAVAFSPDGKTAMTGSSDNTARLWDTATGKEVKRLEGHSEPVMSARFLPDNQIVVIGHGRVAEVTDKTPWLWNATSGNGIIRFNGHAGWIPSAEVSTDGQRFLTGSLDKTVRLWDASTGKEIRQFAGHTDLARGVMSADGRVILTASNDKTARLWDAATGREIRRFAGHTDWVTEMMLSRDGRVVATGGDTTARCWDASTGKEIRRFEDLDDRGQAHDVTPLALAPDGRKILLNSRFGTLKLCDVATGAEIVKIETETGIRCAAFSRDGQMLMICGDDYQLRMWDASTGNQIKSSDEEIRSLIGQSDSVGPVAFSPDGQFSLTAGEDRTAQLRNAMTGQELCRMVAFDDGTWVVVDREGRFDTNNLDEIRGLHWILPDDAFKPQPIEIFMREYYEPRLLARILAGEKFKPVKLLSDLNRVQPVVAITSIRPEPGADEVTVTVEVSKASGTVQRGGKRVTLESGVYDLRLFRDGQLVGYAPAERGAIEIDPATGKAVKTFKVRLPRARQTEFSAYAFNADQVKSATDRKVFELPKDLAVSKGRAYLVSVGVNAYETADFDLNFAANDARRVQKIVSDRLAKTGDYEEIIQVPLVSDHKTRDGKRVLTEKTATKGNLKTVIALLSGHQMAAELTKDIPSANKIRQARPEDLVLISFSSHGFADEDGNFYFVPYDTGLIKEGAVTEELIKRCISSEELALWLRDVDAGEMVMIADACHSAATVETEGFKPGPMGSRGLGQLAYDKRMRILTSTQADDVALESELIKQGLLTYALTHDGIEAGQADFKPKDNAILLAEWLEYGVSRVPALYEEVKRGELQSFGRGEKRGMVVSSKKNDSTSRENNSSRKKPPYQQPSLFDFSRKKHDVALVKGN